MRIKHTLTALVVAVAVGALGLASAGPASAAGTGGTRPYPEGSQGPCSPGGIWHPDPGWPGTGGWCEYPKKKCWWTCPKTKAMSTQVQPAEPIRTVRPVSAASIYTGASLFAESPRPAPVKPAPDAATAGPAISSVPAG